MNSSHISLAYCRTLSRNQLRRAIQWRPKATFISLSGNPPTTADDKSRKDLLNIGNVDEERKTQQLRLGSPREKRKSLRQPSPYNDGDILEALFEETLKQPSPELAEAPSYASSIGPYIHAGTLRTMLADEGGSVADTWKFFVGHFGLEAWRNGSVDQKSAPKNLHISMNILKNKVLEAKRSDPFSLDLPTITDFSRVYSQWGVLRAGNWCQAMLVLLEHLLKLDQSPPEDSVHKERAISDLIGAWNVVFRKGEKAQEYPPSGSPLDWSHRPTISIRESSNSYRRHGMRSIFAQFAPSFQLSDHTDFAVVAVATFALLTRDSVADETAEASPLISSLSTAVAFSGFNIGTLAGTENVPPAVEEFIHETASKTKEAAINMQVSLVGDEAANKSISESRPYSRLRTTLNRSVSSSIRTDIASISKRLYDALQREDIVQVDKMWSDVKGYPVINEQSDVSMEVSINPSINSDRGRLTADLCNYFVMIYMALRVPNGAVQVWNHMVRSGLPPSLKTWDAMMNGCKLCRDHKALEDVWMRMQQLGVQPDVVCWTTRISGLFECNKLEKGMQALDEMGRLWVAASKSVPQGSPKQKKGLTKEITSTEPVHHAIKPTIVTVNAALSGLLRKHETEAAHRVLAWAARFDVKPDVITYNILLTPLIKDGQSRQAMSLLKQMEREGIKADVATFTTILDEMFRNSNELSPMEQTAITDNVFSEMETAGVKANIQTYSKMIHQLLIGSNKDLRPVNAVMKQMAARGIPPTTYIYTMLITFYLEQDPPDLDAVRNLIENAKIEVGSVNHVFWDRVIEGYARNGETATALKYLRELESRGGYASWVARQVLLSALAQNDQWAAAKTFVEDVKSDPNVLGPRPAHEMKGKEGQQRFWRLAAELELL